MISAITEPVRAPIASIHNWVAGRVELRTSYMQGQGKQRFYSLDNALELAFLAAFTNAGVKASEAVAYAHMLRDNRFGPFPRFLVFAEGDAKHTEATDKESYKHWKSLFPNAESITVIEPRAIADRVVAYFDKHGVEV